MLLRFCNRLLVSLALLLIRGYQRFVSPHTPMSCRYLPTCSQYAVEAFKKRGFGMGFWLTTKRLLSCHPLATPRVDEVPENETS